MKIHSSKSEWFTFSLPYNAKRLLDDSITRTLRGYNLIGEGTILTGCGYILLGRIESVVACAFVSLSSALFVLGSIIATPCFLLPGVALNLASRIPGISSFETVQNFIRESSNVIYRTLKINFIAIPIIFLFLSASIVNTFLPGILKPQNIFSRSIHWMVESLGPLQTIRVVVPGAATIVGTEKNLSILAVGEEHFRALSSQNYLREVVASDLTHYYYR